MKLSVIRTKIAALILTGAILVSNTALGIADTPRGWTLAPPVATKPLGKIIRDKSGKWDVITDDDLARYWDEETARSVKAGETLGKSFRNRWAFVDVSFLMGQALKLQISKHTLIPLIKKHIENRDGTAEILLEGYDIDGIEEVRKDDEIMAFSLPVTREGSPAYKLIYSLTKDAETSAAIPLSDGTNIYMKAEVPSALERKGFILAPSILNVPDDERTSKAAEAIEIGREEGIQVIAHFDVIDSNDGKGTAIVQPGAKDTMDELRSEKVGEIIEKTEGEAVVDVHLMVMEPTEEFIQGYIKEGAGIITLHWEGFEDKDMLLERLRFIRKHGVKAGIAMNPDVDIEAVCAFISENRQEIDMVLQMSVYPGLGGQKFMKEVLGNIVKIRKEYGYTGLIEIDGGVNKDTIKDAKEAGVNVFVAGSAFFRKEDMSREGVRESCRTLKASLMEEVAEARPPSSMSGLPVTWTDGLKKEGLRVASVQLKKDGFNVNTDRMVKIVEDLSGLATNAPDLVIFPELMDIGYRTDDEARERMEILQKVADRTGIAIVCCIEYNIRTDRGYFVDCNVIYPGQKENNRRFQKFSFGEEDRLFTLKDHKISLLICVETISALKNTDGARKVSEQMDDADIILVPSATRQKSAGTWAQILHERHKKPVMLLNRADGDKAGKSTYISHKDEVFSLGEGEEILIADVPEGLETGPDIGEKQARDILYRLWSREEEKVEAAKAELSELLQDRFRTPVEDGIYVGNRTPVKAGEIARAVFYILGEEAAERSGNVDLMVDGRFKNAIIEHIIFILSQKDAVDRMVRLNGLELGIFWDEGAGDLDSRPLYGEDPLLDERHVRYWTAIRNHEKVNPGLEKDKALYLASMGGVSEGLLAAGCRHLVMMEKKNFYDSAGSMRLSEKDRMMYREAKRSIKSDESRSHGSLMHDAACQYLGGHLLPFVLDELDAMEARDVVVSRKRSEKEEGRDYYEIRFKWAQWGMEYEEYKVTFIDNLEIKPGSETAPAKVPFRETLLKDIDILMLKAGLALSSEEHFAGTEGINNAQDAASALTPYIRLLNENGVFIGDVTEMIKREILLQNKELSYVQAGDEIREIESEEDGGIWFGYNPVKLFLLSGKSDIRPNSVEGIPVLWSGGFEKQGLRVACVQLQDDVFYKNTERIKNIVEGLGKLGADAPDLVIFPEVLDRGYASGEYARGRISVLQEVADRTNIAIGLSIEYESPDPEDSHITYNIIKPGHSGRHIVFRKTYYARESRIFSIKDRKIELLICIETQAVLQNVVDLLAMSKEINGSDMIIVPAATKPGEVKKWSDELRRFFGKPVIYLNWSNRGEGGNTSYYSKEKKTSSVEDVEAILMVDAFKEPEKEVPPSTVEEEIKTDQKTEAAVISAETERVQAQVFSDTIKLIQAEQEEQPIILALGTSWIKGYEKGRYLQYDAINPLISSIREFCRAKGITFIDSDDSGLLAAINAERDKEGKKDAKVIVLAGKDTVTSDEFEPLRSSDNIFMAGVDNEKLTVDNYMRLVEMMTLTLQLAFGQDIDLDNPNILIKKHDRFPNVYIFIPNAEPMDYEVLKEIYRVQIFA